MPTSKQAVGESLSGLTDFLRVLEGVSADVRTELLAQGVEAVGRRMESAARSFAPSETGALKASIATKVVRNPQRGTAAAIVGPARGAFVGGHALGKKVRGGHKPSKYAHLIEYGHVAVAPRKGTTRRKHTAKEVGFVAARPFMRPAVALIAPVAAQTMADAIGAGIERAAKKYRS